MNETASKTPVIEAKRSSQPRAPRRERGVQRYRELLDALEKLLETNNPDDVGIYQIAEEAKAAPASTYHFFPTKEAAFTALAARYLQRFERSLYRAVPASAFDSWRALMAHDSRSSAHYFNQHPAALKLLIGRYGGVEVRNIDIQHNQTVGRKYLRRIRSAFDLPDIPDGESKFHTVLEIQDAIWAISYVKFGRITAEYENEAILAVAAYLRCYYPEIVALREDVREQIMAGAPLILPGGWRTDPDAIDQGDAG